MILGSKKVPKRVSFFGGGASWGTFDAPSHFGTQKMCPKCYQKCPEGAKMTSKRIPRTPQKAKCDPKRYPKAMNINSNRCSILIKDSNRATNSTRPGGLREALSIKII